MMPVVHSCATESSCFVAAGIIVFQLTAARALGRFARLRLLPCHRWDCRGRGGSCNSGSSWFCNPVADFRQRDGASLRVEWVVLQGSRLLMEVATDDHSALVVTQSEADGCQRCQHAALQHAVSVHGAARRHASNLHVIGIEKVEEDLGRFRWIQHRGRGARSARDNGYVEDGSHLADPRGRRFFSGGHVDDDGFAGEVGIQLKRVAPLQLSDQGRRQLKDLVACVCVAPAQAQDAVCDCGVAGSIERAPKLRFADEGGQQIVVGREVHGRVVRHLAAGAQLEHSGLSVGIEGALHQDGTCAVRWSCCGVKAGVLRQRNIAADLQHGASIGVDAGPLSNLNVVNACNPTLRVIDGHVASDVDTAFHSDRSAAGSVPATDEQGQRVVVAVREGRARGLGWVGQAIFRIEFGT
mmetsp:Transcript_5351/g.15720  ORF Transcript_5351/g.15720 Transcript_5351/m.15720 type:complete len:411 (+) Transcript_5351:1616-2848(+)